MLTENFINNNKIENEKSIENLVKPKTLPKKSQQIEMIRKYKGKGI